jgi:hypothetical protein
MNTGESVHQLYIQYDVCNVKLDLVHRSRRNMTALTNAGGFCRTVGSRRNETNFDKITKYNKLNICCYYSIRWLYKDK